jgi:phage-related protein
MLEGVHFSYAGIKSSDMGLINVKIDGGMFEEPFLPTRQIEEVSVRGRDKPYFQEVRLEPLSFELSFAFEYGYDEKKIREVARWLCQPYYQPFYTIDNPDRIFYCMVDGDSRLIHNGLKQGYITLTMRCDSPYSYSPKYTKENMVFGSTKVAKSIVENTFSSGLGLMRNVKVNSNNELEVEKTFIAWSFLAGRTWGDL